MQFCLRLYSFALREEAALAPTQQATSVEVRAAPQEQAGSRPRQTASGWILGRLAPGRISAIYLRVVFVVLFGMLRPDVRHRRGLPP